MKVIQFPAKTISLVVLFFGLGVLLSYWYMTNKLNRTQKLYAIDEKQISACNQNGVDLLWCYGNSCGTVNMVKTWGKYDDTRKSLEQQKKSVSNSPQFPLFSFR